METTELFHAMYFVPIPSLDSRWGPARQRLTQVRVAQKQRAEQAWEYRKALYISCGYDRYLHVFSKTETDGNGADRDVTSNLCLPQFLTTDEFVLSGPLGGVHRTG